ncbi:HET-domain-containing protein [Diaporthe amygdali]|uniref:HET-domain-containing protein n=1 Tax=Phomopsis amygdali TaxID=1214568 RepID=UPI0022FEC372|nr:HET-domain-containing protein [Diaporthe amygdali]KAJ0110255.1 HET-domain-containing protein [Diaporthe amygdali]
MAATEIMNFEHTPLPGSKWIRLLKFQPELENGCISCRLDFFEPTTSPGYTALSYAWGDATPRHEIYINGRHRKVHENLWRFLRRCFESGFSGYLWTDLLCLDQANAPELAVQISRMADIYEGAEEVAIWLGDDPILEQEFQSRTYSVAAKLSYWKRVWIIQEIAFARKLTIIYGSCEVGWDEFQIYLSMWVPQG